MGPSGLTTRKPLQHFERLVRGTEEALVHRPLVARFRAVAGKSAINRVSIGI